MKVLKVVDSCNLNFFKGILKVLITFIEAQGMGIFKLNFNRAKNEEFILKLLKKS